jgi:hypothetical protein
MSSSLINIATKLAPDARLKGEELLAELRQDRKTFAAVKIFCEAQRKEAKSAGDLAAQVLWELTLRYVDTQWTKECRDRPIKIPSRR